MHGNMNVKSNRAVQRWPHSAEFEPSTLRHSLCVVRC